MVVGHGQLEVQFQGAFDLLFAALPIVGAGESDAQGEVRIGEIRVDRQGLLRQFLLFGSGFLARQQESAQPAVTVASPQ